MGWEPDQHTARRNLDAPHSPNVVGHAMHGRGHIMRIPAVQHVGSTAIGAWRVTRCSATVLAPRRICLNEDVATGSVLCPVGWSGTQCWYVVQVFFFLISLFCIKREPRKVFPLDVFHFLPLVCFSAVLGFPSWMATLPPPPTAARLRRCGRDIRSSPSLPAGAPGPPNLAPGPGGDPGGAAHPWR